MAALESMTLAATAAELESVASASKTIAVAVMCRAAAAGLRMLDERLEQEIAERKSLGIQIDNFGKRLAMLETELARRGSVLVVDGGALGRLAQKAGGEGT